jgi:N-acetylhexosamine 1-kinase
MTEDSSIMDAAAEALASMGVKDAVAVRRYGNGHINDTFKVDTAGGAVLVLQRVNTSIFTDLKPLEANVRRVTSHLAAKGVKSLEVLGYDGPWRLFAFVDGFSREVVETPADAYATALAYAKFQNDLADLPPSEIAEILPRFHDTPDRIRQLDEAAAADAAGRRASVAAELAFVDARRGDASRIVDLVASGDIPLRLAHNDSKSNNVLVSDDGSSVVIDLDTVMPGTGLSDFGDMVRSASASAAEDEPDLSKVRSVPERFEAIARGYLDGAKFLNEAEKANLVAAGRLSTFEVGVRFLADYLAGDVYFKTAFPEHNLVRARNQFKMVESIEEQSVAYEETVRRIVKP